MTVGERIKLKRLEKGLTQAQLGTKCGIAQPTIRSYEGSILKPKLGTLEKIADALEIHVSELLPESVRIQAPLPNTLSSFFMNLTHRRDTPEMEFLLKKNHKVEEHFISQLEALYNLGEDRYSLTALFDCILKYKFPKNDLLTLMHLVDYFALLDDEGKLNMIRHAADEGWLMKQERSQKND